MSGMLKVSITEQTSDKLIGVCKNVLSPKMLFYHRCIRTYGQPSMYLARIECVYM